MQGFKSKNTALTNLERDKPSQMVILSRKLRINKGQSVRTTGGDLDSVLTFKQIYGDVLR